MGLGLGLNGYLYGGLGSLVALDGAFVLAYGLDLTEGDVLLVNLNTGGLESLFNLSCSDRTVVLAGLADLYGTLTGVASILAARASASAISLASL